MQHLERICSRNTAQDTFAPGALELLYASSLTPHASVEFSGRTSPECVEKSVSPRSPPSLQGEAGDYPHCLFGSRMSANDVRTAELAPNRNRRGASSPSRNRQVSNYKQANKQWV